MRPLTREQILDRINTNVKKIENGCWIWQGALGGSGRYALVNWHQKLWRVTRLRYELEGRRLKAHELACHTCDTPSCVNPEHIFIGDGSANQQDSIAKNRKSRCKGETNGMAKVDASDVREILRLLKKGVFQRKVAKMFGTSQSNVSAIARGVSWNHITGLERKRA